MELKKKVKYVLNNYPETRNSDKALFIQIVKTYHDFLVGEYDSILLEDLFKLPSYDTVSRWRRKIQEGGEYVATDEKVAKKRFQNQSEVKNELGYNRGKEMSMFDNQALHHINSIQRKFL